jgi:prepilin-type N-terminal cleavage/methylation domain-containing protein
MKGVTLLEFLVAISLFSLILFLSYHSFEEQRFVVNQIESRTRPEEESNYRMLLIKHFVEKSSSRLKVDPFLEGSQIFFPDLSFGSVTQKNAFSIAHIVGDPFPFIHFGNSWKVPLTSEVERSKTYLLAGSDSSGNFGWVYCTADQVYSGTDYLTVTFTPLMQKPLPEEGTLIEVEIYGVLFQNHTLFWISPGGSQQPYFDGLDSFEYTWNNPMVTIAWQKGAIKAEFRCVL